jgi:hypothetical protein
MLPEMKKKQSKRTPSKTKLANKVKDYGNDPFFVKKAADSKSFLEKTGFPKELLTRK